MSREENNYKLLFSIISQMSTNGQLRGIDWALVANDLGLERATAASLRWTRFKQSTGLSLPGSSGARASTKVTKSKGGSGVKGGANSGKKAGGAGKGGAKKKGKKSGSESDEAYGGDEGYGGADLEANGVQENVLGEGEQEEIYGDAQEYVEEGYGGEVQYGEDQQFEVKEEYGDEQQGNGYVDYGDDGDDGEDYGDVRYEA
jgi:hypothetical protein